MLLVDGAVVRISGGLDERLLLDDPFADAGGRFRVKEEVLRLSEFGELLRSLDRVFVGDACQALPLSLLRSLGIRCNSECSFPVFISDISQFLYFYLTPAPLCRRLMSPASV